VGTIFDKKKEQPKIREKSPNEADVKKLLSKITLLSWNILESPVKGTKHTEEQIKRLEKIYFSPSILKNIL
jgi:hypothetical protein